VTPRTETLFAVQGSLRHRFDEFRGALERRDEAAYRMALSDFHGHLCRWTAAEERVLLPLLTPERLPGRDPQRELRLEYVQIRELTRYLLSELVRRAPMADVLGLVENLERRLTSHESEMRTVYYPAVSALLDADAWRQLDEAAPPP
jgi:hemerythrin HHE cation binding domain-containing protein